jgi:hypothetical protein
MDAVSAGNFSDEPGPLDPGLAEHLANATYVNLQEVHRGVLPCAPCGGAAVFGNDDFTGREQTQREVDVLRRGLGAAGAVEVAFGVNSLGNPGYTWVLLTRPADAPPAGTGQEVGDDFLRRLFELLWRAWAEAWQVADADAAAQSYRRAQQGRAAGHCAALRAHA